MSLVLHAHRHCSFRGDSLGRLNPLALRKVVEKKRRRQRVACPKNHVHKRGDHPSGLLCLVRHIQPSWAYRKIHNQAKQKDHLHRLFILLGLSFSPPLVCRLRGAVHTMEHAGVLKFTIVTAIVSALWILTYHFLVRNTLVGLMLNGKKNPWSDTLPHGLSTRVRTGKEFSMEVLNAFSISMIIFHLKWKILSEIMIINTCNHC